MKTDAYNCDLEIVSNPLDQGVCRFLKAQSFSLILFLLSFVYFKCPVLIYRLEKFVNA